VIRAFGVCDPVATVTDGEEFWVETRDCYDGQVASELTLRSMLDVSRFMPCTGPIAVEGAVPGTSLRVDILNIEPAEHGFMPLRPGMGILGSMVARETTVAVPIDTSAGTLRLGSLVVPLHLMVGAIGTAPLGKPISSNTPGDHGGNLDTREIAPGATLCLPVFAPGALLALGDLHAAMGDGELNGQGVETPGRVRLRVHLSSEPLQRPRLETVGEWITLATGTTLEEALRLAASDMVDLLRREYGLEFDIAYRLLSIAGQARISQVVDPLVGAKVAFPKNLARA
jgi:amidase